MANNEGVWKCGCGRDQKDNKVKAMFNGKCEFCYAKTNKIVWKEDDKEEN